MHGTCIKKNIKYYNCVGNLISAPPPLPTTKVSGTCVIFVDDLRYLTLDLGKYSDPQCGINLSIFPAPGSMDRLHLLHLALQLP